MKVNIRAVESGHRNHTNTIAEIKLHRHTVQVLFKEEMDAYELEELLKKVKQINIRRYK